MRYLAVVNPWSSAQNPQLRRCSPLCDEDGYTFDPVEQFPNNGQIFIVCGGDLETSQLVLCQVKENLSGYDPRDPNTCQFLIENVSQIRPKPLKAFFDLVDLPGFDPQRRELRDLPFLPTTPFFVHSPAVVWGPLEVDEYDRPSPSGRVRHLTWKVHNERGLVLRVPVEVFRQTVKVLDCPVAYDDFLNFYGHRLLVHRLDPLRELWDQPEFRCDVLTEEELVRWYYRQVGPGSLDASVLHTLAEEIQAGLPQAEGVIQERLKRLLPLVQTAAMFQEERRKMVEAFLESPPGQQMLQANLESLVAHYVERLRDKIEAEVRREYERQQGTLAGLKQRQVHLRAELQRLRHDHDRARQEQEQRVQALAQTELELRAAIDQDIEKLAAQLQEHVPALAIWTRGLTAVASSPWAGALSSVGGGRPPELNGGPLPVEFRLEPEPEIYVDIPSERVYVEQLQVALRQRGRGFDYFTVANWFVCLKTSGLTLVAGYPGMGKSSLVRLLAELLGHSARFLAIAVQRSWTDGRDLLGYPNVLHQRYEAPPGGLVEQLIRAQRDYESHLGGLYLILLDDMNLAPAEHYLAGFMNVLEAEGDQDRILRLYDVHLDLQNSSIYPPQVTVFPNVRFWGTVNLDDTSEPLSPRLLDRANVLWLDPPAESWEEAHLVTSSLPGALSYEQLRKDFLRTVELPLTLPASLQQVCHILERPQPEWGRPHVVSPRIRWGIARYLANSVDLMDEETALDFQILQRILPGLRGYGERFARRLEALTEVVQPFPRTQRRLMEMLELGREQGEEFDYFRR